MVEFNPTPGFGTLNAATKARLEANPDTNTLSDAELAKLIALPAGPTFPPAAHTHAIGDVTDLTDALAGKAASSHTHTLSQITDWAATVATLQPLLVSGANIKTINGVNLLGSGNIVVEGGGGGGTPTWGGIGGTLADQTDLQTALDGKAPTSHTHAIGDVTDLAAELDGKASTSALQAAVDGRVAVVDADGDPATPRPAGVVSALWIGSPTMPDEAVPGADLVLLPAGAPNRDPARGRSTSSTAFTLALDDMNTIVVCTSASSVVVTIPAEVTEAFPDWSLVNILRRGAGTVTITAAEGVTLNGAVAGSVVISAQHGVAALAKIGTDEWNIAGAVE